jgi:hypothetical protein
MHWRKYLYIGPHSHIAEREQHPSDVDVIQALVAYPAQPRCELLGNPDYRETERIRLGHLDHYM